MGQHLVPPFLGRGGMVVVLCRERQRLATRVLQCARKRLCYSRHNSEGEGILIFLPFLTAGFLYRAGVETPLNF